MKLSRRKFVKAGGASALAVAALSGATLGMVTSGDALEGLTAANFRRLTGQEFYIWNERTSVMATLARFDELPKGSATGDCFGLLFDTTKSRTVEGTYNVFNAEIGNFELFVTATKSGRRGGFYATINRI